MPETNSQPPDVYKYTYDEILLPEGLRYTAVLDILHRDPVKFSELFVYVPVLRRILRFSKTAVCAQDANTDNLNDDNCSNIGNCQQVPLFDSKLLGEKKMLFMVHMNPDATNARGDDDLPLQQYFYSSKQDIAAAGFDFVKPSAGTWELRDVYLLALRRLSSFPVSTSERIGKIGLPSTSV